jgi:hypothetical protein
MALAGRSTRRGATGRRWILIGIVLTLLVLLIDASLKARSNNDSSTLSTQAWVDQALPIIQSTNAEAQIVNEVRTQGLKMSARTITAQLNSVATNAKKTYQEAVALHPAASVAGAAGLLEASLLVRSQAGQEYATAMAGVLSSPVPQDDQADRAENAVLAAVQDMEVSDRAYNLFISSLPNIGTKIPASQWVPNKSQYQPATLETFLVSLRSSTSLTPVHKLEIQAISTIPSPVSSNNGVEVLPTQDGIQVTVVVINVGNQQENNLTITASISPAQAGYSVRQFASLAPDGAQSIQLGNLYPLQGQDATLTLTVTPLPDSPTPVVSKSITVFMPAPGTAPPTAPTTTTTTPNLTTPTT